MAQPGIVSASLDNTVSPPASTVVYPFQAHIVYGVFSNDGYGLTYAFFTFETYPSPNYSCKVGVQLGIPYNTSTFYLHDDNGNPMPGMGSWTGQQQDNSKCALFSNGSTVTLSSDYSKYTVAVNVMFKDPYNG